MNYKPGNRKTSRQKCEFGIEGITAELYIFQGYTEILSVYGAKEIIFRHFTLRDMAPLFYATREVKFIYITT